MNDPRFPRRDLFEWGINGLAATALATLLHQESQATMPMAARTVGSNGKAKRAIQICLVGGLSHLDSFDHKPALTRLHGSTLKTDEQVDLFFGQMGLLRKEDWAFHPRGESGLMISDLFPEIA
ncbi:MAG: DUF1501 domain-containing protein, partial [Pirellulales bacterium]